MKAISIKQPFAWLIVNGIKDIENRTWKTDYRGPLLIHASKTWDQKGYDAIEGLLMTWGKDILPEKETSDYGYLIGMVNMVDCVKESPSEWFFGPYGFVFESPEAWERPMPYRGKLSLFEVSDEDMGEFIYCKEYPPTS